MWVRELVNRMGLPRTTTLADLRETSAEELVRAGQSMLLNTKELVQLNTSFMPTVDGETLTAHPIDTFEAGEQAAVPLIVGTNSDEASFAKAIYQTTKSRQRAARRALEAFDPENAQSVLHAYDYAGERGDYADLIADAVFWAPTVILATAHRRKASTWMYRFDHASAAMRMLGLGAMHTADLGAVFGEPNATKASRWDVFGGSEAFAEVSRVMQHHWGQFFHTGAPGEEWPVYGFRSDDRPGRATAVFDAGMRVEWDPKASQRRAWEGFDMREWGTHRQDLMDSAASLLGAAHPSWGDS